jgi:hypothetical protein
MINLEDVVGTSGDVIHVWGRTEKKKFNSGGKGNSNQRRRSKSKRPPGDLF